MENLEAYFEQFRKNIIGIDKEFESPYGKKKIVYADWIASGRLYAPIEEKIQNLFGPMVGNTHSEASETGIAMTQCYRKALKIIKEHVNANSEDIIITEGSGMTSVINKFQRILGLKIPEQARKYCTEAIPENERPVVFISHMEHHSNQTSWLETIADVVILEPTPDLLVCPENLETELLKYKDRKVKIGSFSAGSNVTGIISPYYKLAEIMHKNGGCVFIDFAASAPYVNIDMHPANPLQKLDAIFFSPHKALGGPGSSGVLVFNKELYKNKTPDVSGGGTVIWTNRWNEYSYVCDIESREDGGTPGFLQTIRTALSLKLKEKMGVHKIELREKELIKIAIQRFEEIPHIHLLAKDQHERLGVFSFYFENAHHNLIVKILNDRFGIQVRGGCSCAGTYGHFLLNVTKIQSDIITQEINHGDLSHKPGWIRMSIHPTMTNAELTYIMDSIEQTVTNIDTWKNDYVFSKSSGEFVNISVSEPTGNKFSSWFEFV